MLLSLLLLVFLPLPAYLLWLVPMLSWLFCCCWCPGVACVHPVASFPALAGGPEVTGVLTIAVIPAVIYDQFRAVAGFLVAEIPALSEVPALAGAPTVVG